MGDVLVAGKNSIYWSYIDRLADEHVYPKEINVVPFFKNVGMVYVDFIPSLYALGDPVRIFLNSHELTTPAGVPVVNASGLIWIQFAIAQVGNFTIYVKSLDTLTTYKQSTFNAKIMYDPLEVFGVEMSALRVEQQKTLTDTIYTHVRDEKISQNFAQPMGVEQPLVFGLSEYRSMLVGNSLPGIRTAFLRAGSIRGVRDVVRSITGIDPIITKHRDLKTWTIFGPGATGDFPYYYPGNTIPESTDVALNPYEFHASHTAGSYSIQYSATQSALHVKHAATAPFNKCDVLFYRDGTDVSLDNSVGWSMECRFSVIDVQAFSVSFGGSDGVREVRCAVNNGNIILERYDGDDHGWSSGLPPASCAFQGTGFHVARLTVDGNSANIYLDGAIIPILSGTVAVGAGVAAKHIAFGVLRGATYDVGSINGGKSEYLIDYLSWTYAGAFAPTAYFGFSAFPYTDDDGVSVEDDIQVPFDIAYLDSNGNAVVDYTDPAGHSINIPFGEPLEDTNADGVNDFGEDLVISIYDGRYLDFSLTLLSRQSIRQVFQEAIVRNIYDPADVTTLDDQLSNRYPLHWDGATVIDPDRMYITQGASVWTEGPDFSVSDLGVISWLGASRPADKSIYYVDYRFFMKDIIIPLVERVKPAVSLIEYEFI